MASPLIFDRGHRADILFTGPNAVATLNGLVSNDVAAKTAGQGVYGLLLTSKGKILADVRVLVREDGVLLDAPANASANAREMIRKFVNPRFATYRDISEETSTIGVYGEHASAAVSAVVGLATDRLSAMNSYDHVVGGFAGAEVLVVRTPELGIEGYDLIAQTEIRDGLMAGFRTSGATEGHAAQFEALRIEAGWPSWGIDMDDSTLPQEANMEELGAISFNKGCYIGQEPVARIHFRGHVNKTLRTLAFATTLPPSGARLLTDEGQDVGDVRSVAQSARLGAIGIGMVRREIADDGTLLAKWTEPDGAERETAVQITGKAKGAIG